MMLCPCRKVDVEAHPVFARGETDFRMCSVCGLVFRERFPSASELVEIYRKIYALERIVSGQTDQESGTFAAKSYADFLTRRLLRHGMRVLDFGAGTGALVEALRAHGFAADGIEFSMLAREYCRTHRSFTLLANLDEVPDACFDAVVMIEVIEHVADLPGTLAAIWRVLVPGGLLFVTTPNRNGLRARLEGGYWREVQKKFHLFLFDSNSLKYHLEAVGFQVVRRVLF